jgi:hypothetical protein
VMTRQASNLRILSLEKCSPPLSQVRELEGIPPQGGVLVKKQRSKHS